MMRKALVLAVLICVPASAEEDGFYKYQYPGYDNMPQIQGMPFTVHQKDRPQPRRVVPTNTSKNGEMDAPSDAIVLFDGTTLEQFQDNSWKIEDGILVAGHGGLITKSAFGDCQLHVQWRAPNPPQGAPINMGNSGIFFMNLYELQIYDSYSSRIYADGSAASVYGQTPPLVNVCRPPGQWQTYDVLFSAPEFESGTLVAPARITALHNGVLVQHNTKILGPTRHKKALPYKPHPTKVPMRLQGHGSPVEFRQIWIREIGNKQ